MAISQEPENLSKGLGIRVAGAVFAQLGCDLDMKNSAIGVTATVEFTQRSK